MAIKTTKIKGLFIVERQVFGDERGFFIETFRMNELAESLGYEPKFVQQNHSRSAKNVLRGIHTAEWDKLVYAARGEAFCAFVDMRPESETFGQKEEIIIGENNRVKVYIEKGIGNSVCVLSDTLDYLYDVTDYYAPERETATKWNDEDLNINWPITDPILSKRDIEAISFRERFPDKFK